jgi:flavin-dependent dehydrogenase
MNQDGILFLTIHKVGNGKRRFYLNTEFSKGLNVFRGYTFIFHLEGETFNVKTTCGKPKIPVVGKKYKKGYDLYSKEIKHWIDNHPVRIKGCKVFFSYSNKINNGKCTLYLSESNPKEFFQ